MLQLSMLHLRPFAGNDPRQGAPIFLSLYRLRILFTPHSIVQAGGFTPSTTSSPALGRFASMPPDLSLFSRFEHQL